MISAIILKTAYLMYASYRAYEAYKTDSAIPLLEAYSGLATVAKYVPYVSSAMSYADANLISFKNNIKTKGLIKYKDEGIESLKGFYNSDNKIETIKKQFNFSGGDYFSKQSAVNVLDTIKQTPQFIEATKQSVNTKLEDYTPSEVVLTTLGVGVGTVGLYKYGLMTCVWAAKEGMKLLHKHNIMTSISDKGLQKGKAMVVKTFEDNKEDYETFKVLSVKILYNTANSAYEAIKPDVNATKVYDEYFVQPLNNMDSNKTVDYVTDKLSYLGEQVSVFGNAMLYGNATETQVQSNANHGDEL